MLFYLLIKYYNVNLRDALKFCDLFIHCPNNKLFNVVNCNYNTWDSGSGKIFKIENCQWLCYSLPA